MTAKRKPLWRSTVHIVPETSTGTVPVNGDFRVLRDHHPGGPTLVPLVRCKVDGELRPLARNPAKGKAKR